MPTKSESASKPAPKADEKVVPLRKALDDSAKNTSNFVRDHPVLTVVGGLAAGLAIGLLVRKGAMGKAVRGGIALAEMAGTASALLGKEAMEKAESAGTAGREFGRRVINRAEHAGAFVRERSEDGLNRAGEFLHPAQDTASQAVEAGQRLLRRAADLIVRTRH